MGVVATSVIGAPGGGGTAGVVATPVIGAPGASGAVTVGVRPD